MIERMQEKMQCVVRYQGKTFTFPERTTYLEAVKTLKDPSDPTDVLLVMEDNRLRELTAQIRSGAEIRFVDLSDPMGQRAYLRSVSLLLFKSLTDMYPGDERYAATIQRSVNNGLYATLQDPSVLSDALIAAVLENMRNLQEASLPIVKHIYGTGDASKLFEKEGMYGKKKLMRYRLSSYTRVYELDGYFDYYYGYMVHNTGLLKKFDLQRYEEGFVILAPKASDIQGDPYFEDHRKLFRVQRDTSLWGVAHQAAQVGDLNRWIVSGEAKELILTQEAYHEMQIARIAKEIAEQPTKRLIMIAGPSSSGKTTFSHRLSTQLRVFGKTPHPIPMDDYFVNRDRTPLDKDGKPDFECLEALDVEQFNKDMTALLKGERVELPTYNFKTGKREYRGRFKQLGENDVLVIEGIHGLNDKLSYSLPAESKYKIYISAMTQLNLDEHDRIPTTDGRLLRRIVRDARTRGTSAEGTINMWASVRRGEENHIFPYQESADAMFNSSLIYEFAIMKIYAEPCLHSVDPSSPAYQEAKRLLKFLSYFVPLTPECIPMNSLVREFIGGSCFDV